jgi:phage terminase large subunit GpA-like protein
MSTRAPYRTSPEGFDALGRAFTAGLRMFLPPVALTLSEWADRFAFIPKETSANPGRFRTDFAEYQREPMDAVTDPSIETIVSMWAAQTGKTQCLEINPIGYFSHWEPAPMLSVQASLGEAEKFSKNRIAKTIRDTPVLRKLFPSPRSRDSGNTLLNKEFPGGMLVIAGANAPAGLASNPIRVVILGEVDRYEDSAGTEGDPVDLAVKRATTFWNRKILLSSTPHIKNLSRIEKAMQSSDNRRYFVPCPHCGEMQILEWPRLKWTSTKPTDPTEPARVLDWYYVCVNGCEIREFSKHEMIRRGQWRATTKSVDGKTAGFHLNALYSPVLDWLTIIQEWLEAQGSLERMKVFVNTRLAETWEIRGTGANMSELEKRREDYKQLLPAGVLCLTAGVDTQDDRLECSVIGWGLDDERWVIEHRQFFGDPALPDTDPASPWYALRDYLQIEWEHAYGVTMRVQCALIDSGGHHTERVYDFTRKHELRHWHAIVGRPGIGKVLLSTGNKVGPYKTLLYTVGVDTAKEDIFTSFRVAKVGSGYCHFAIDLPEDYFRQVTAEKLVKTVKDFVTRMEWVKTGQRNEALDCFVYARAALQVRKTNFRKIKRNLDRWVTEHRAELERVPQAAPADETIGPDPNQPAAESESAAPAPTPQPKPAPGRRRRTGAADQLRSRFGRLGR